MNSQDKFNFWLQKAQYDLETANAMLKADRLDYVVFMCQQAVEKLAQGLYILFIDDNNIRSHNIGEIISKFKPQLDINIPDDTYSFFNELSSFYFDSNNIEHQVKIRLLMNKEKASVILTKTKDVFAWLLTLKP
jgi:HEPN domain-containing protein